MSELNTKIDRETTDKLTYIQQQTKQELSDILRAAIADYYQKLMQTKKKQLLNSWKSQVLLAVVL